MRNASRRVRPEIVTLDSWKFFELFMADLTAEDRQRLFFNAAGEPLPEGFSIHRLEENTGFLTFPLPPLRHFQYDVFFLRKGRAVRVDGLTTYELTAPAIQFTAPGHITTNRESGDGIHDVEGYFLMLDPDFLVAAGQPNLLPEVRPAAVGYLTTRFQNLITGNRPDGYRMEPESSGRGNTSGGTFAPCTIPSC